MSEFEAHPEGILAGNDDDGVIGAKISPVGSVALRAENAAGGAEAWLSPLDAIRFGFHLAGLGAKALRAQR